MFCEGCGKEVNINDKFCINCGTPITVPVFVKQEPKEKFPLGKFIIIVAVVLGSFLGAYFIFTYENNSDDEAVSIEIPDVVDEVVEDSTEDYESSLFAEMNSTIEPLGFFNAPSLYADETVSSDEWLSHVIYTNESKQVVTSSREKQQFPNQIEAMSAVVKIVCEDDEYFYYGSGTNFTDDGYVLTNFHVVEDVLNGESCMVGFPNPVSGLIEEVYWATPIVDSENETGHDLALLSIETPVFDEELNIYGSFNRFKDAEFKFFELLDSCTDKITELGEDVFVLGYPPLSGGALTITNGIISSLYSQDGYFVTSAKIVSGNSGGLAIDKDGCFVGVPTAVYREYGSEQFGEIIDAEYVGEFLNAVDDDIQEYLGE